MAGAAIEQKCPEELVMPKSLRDGSLQQISGNTLDPCIRPMRTAIMRPRKGMAWRAAEPLGPKDSGGIEYKILFGTRINNRLPFGWIVTTLPGSAFCHYLHSVNSCCVPVKFPANKTWNSITFFHTGPSKHPMIRLHYYPVPSSVYSLDISHAHQQPFIRPTLRKRTMIPFPIFRIIIRSPIRSGPKYPSIRIATLTGRKRRYPTNRIT